MFPLTISDKDPSLLNINNQCTKVGEQWKAEMADLTTRYEGRLREAQMRNKQLKGWVEKLKVRF